MPAKAKKVPEFFEKTGLYLGRFQPFHLGHLEVIREAAKQVKVLIIVIGSAQESHTKENPFTDEEREEMVTKSLYFNGFKNFSVIPVDDINDDSQYVKHVEKHVPEFEIVFAAENALTAKLFGKVGYTIWKCPRFKDVSSTKIRELMAKGDNAWKKMVPAQVIESIESIDGVKRVQEIHELI